MQAVGLSERVNLCVADALDSIIEMPIGQQPFDLIFLDADKKRSAKPVFAALLLRPCPLA